MENILDLLYEYSKRGKNVDEEFMDKVIKIMTKEKELKKYIKGGRFENLSSREINHGGKNTPMAYDSYAKKILLDRYNIEIFRNEIKKITHNLNFSDFEQVLSSNSILTQALLHEVEHANQQRKSMIKDENFENLLLGVCWHVDNDFLRESKLSQLLMLKKGIYLNPQLYYNLRLQKQLDVQFKNSLPIERMADIKSTQEIINMLVQINKNDCIENVISLFDSLLARFQLNGYNSNNGIINSPTERYLEEVKKLNIAGMDVHFTEYFDTVMKKAQNASFEKRLLLGLEISEREYQKTKMKLSRN